MTDKVLKIACVLLITSSVYGDIYLHNPRGSNNRHDEDTRNRNNANRLFDSQNNNRGGYNVGGPMKYYAGTKLQIEWTSQHSCAAPNNHCEIILQYMCGPNVRDGTTTQTIPADKSACANTDCDKDTKYGLHESYEHYLKCKLRARNKGLFTADQNMNNRPTAVSTRQENNGKTQRYGYECTEERDYFPYWHSSPWKDIAVLTTVPERCKYYQEESANVKSRWECVFSVQQLEKLQDKVLPNNRLDCENFNESGITGVWKEISSHGLPPPECRETQFSRDNHLGNGLDGQPNRYNWTLPDIKEDNCVLRIRYNISTDDYAGWATNASMNSDKPGEETKLDLAQKYNFPSMAEARQRGYVFKGNPNVKIFDEGNLDFELAIDTSQFGRTFQDRSHAFSIKRRPAKLEGTTIHNVNVRGKRGNIVQVYPAVEYDFVPNTLEMMPGHYIHFQWTGSDNNPGNNDGQGKAKTDRNNVLLLKDKNYPEGNGVQYGPAPTFGHYGNNYPVKIEDSKFLGLSKPLLTKLAFSSDGAVDVNLNNATAYYDLGPQQVSQVGTYHYVCTRNNNFSNRDQKGRIQVSMEKFTEAPLGYMGGYIPLPDSMGNLNAAEGVLHGLHLLRVEVWPVEEGANRVQASGRDLKAGDDFASKFLVVYPQESLTVPGQYILASLKLTSDTSNVAVYRSNSEKGFSTWTKIDTTVNGGVASFQMSSGGVYVARTHSYTVYIVVGVVAVIVIAIIVIGAIVYFKKNPQKWNRLKNETQNVKRNFDSKI